MVDTQVRFETLARMERGFNPRNIAVIGAARHNNHRWIKAHLPFHENHGKVYHVNIDEAEWPGAEALGVQNFRSLMDIPDPIDYVAISVPRQIVPRLLEDCAKKDVAIVHVYTAGFSESGEEEGIRLDNTVEEIARRTGLLLVGPNCLGLYNPALGIRHGENEPYGESGHFGYISQSGSMSSGLVVEANAHDLKISKCISMGNGMILDVPDYIDYLAEDAETKMIGMYIEGLRNPQRFFQSLREASAKKPILVWKVGKTEDAARATAAHTGTPYIRQDIWNALLTRCGAIPIESQEEMIDVVKTFSAIPPVAGYNVGLLAGSGGHSTDMANVFSLAGFNVAPLTERSYEEMGSFFNMIGGNYVNPVQGTPAHHDRIIDILSKDENLDLVVVELSGSRLASDPEFFDERVRIVKDAQAESNKPVAVIVYTTIPRLEPSAREAIDKRFAHEGIPAFHSFQSGARALRSVVDYYALKGYMGD
jgi:acyl-CoA synthetase (NDP forming)